MITKHKKKSSTSLILKEMQMKITAIQFTIRMEMIWESGCPPMLVQPELPFIGWFIHLY